VKKRGLRRQVQLVVGLAVSAVLLWWLFKDTNWAEVGRVVRNADLLWLAAAVGLVVVSFVVRIFRWQALVAVEPPPRFMKLFNATQIGFFANFVLPARLGEVIRAVVLSRGTGIPVSKSLAFVAVDRITDLVGLAGTLVFTVVFFHPTEAIYLPEEMRGLYDGPISATLIRRACLGAAAAIVVGLTGAFVLAASRGLAERVLRRTVGPFSPALAARLAALADHFTSGMAVVRSPWRMARACGISLVLWTVFALTNWCAFMALRLEVPWYAPFVTLSLLAVFISLPGPPGFIGPYHVAIAGSLLLVNPAMNVDEARAMAIMAHLLNMLPVVVVGVWCLSAENVSLAQVKETGESLADAEEARGEAPQPE
jgi:uncharacterized membrane protein YbhN (UPF0104 family)